MHSIKNISYQQTPQSTQRNIEKDYQIQQKILKKKKITIIIIVSIILGLGIIATICAIFIPKKKSEDKNHEEVSDDIISPISPIFPGQEELDLEAKKLGSEFDFNTKEGDLKRIFVSQKYTEDRLIDGEKVTTFLTRITNYDIYIISEKNSTEENKYFYDKIYECAISINSECYTSTNEECTPNPRVDLLNTVTRNTEEKRNLEENNKLKDSPIPICLFNLTNNDVITSISCPKSYPEFKKKMLVLDLYFFRPPGIKRLRKDNINDTITRRTEGDKKYIRESNGGICDIENAQFSFCTTDMNTTTDLNNTILSYDEVAIMNITTDEQNSYVKTKETHLIDETYKIENLDKKKYEENLNKFINKLNPYLEKNELFSKEDFNEVYLVSKNGMAAYKKMDKMQKSLKQ